MKAIILAADSGLNAGPKLPKCLLRIGETTLISRQVNLLRRCDVENITVIIGNEDDIWTASAVNYVKCLGVNTIVNQKSRLTKSCYSLYLGIDNNEIEDMIIIDGDLVFDTEILRAMIELDSKTAVFTLPGLHVNDDPGRILVKNGIIVPYQALEQNTTTFQIYGGIFCISLADINDIKYLSHQMENYHVVSLIQELSNHLGITAVSLDDVRNQEIPKFLVGGSFASLKKLIIVRKEARNRGVDKLSREIIWLQQIPENIANYFPKLIGSYISFEYAWYEVPYYPFPSLRRLLLNQEIGVEEAIFLIDNILSFVFKNLYEINRVKGDIGWVYRLHIQRVETRLQQLMNENEVMAQVIAAPEVEINGVSFRNIPDMINQIRLRPMFIEKVAPPIISKIHGDLHFQNILVNQVRSADPLFVLMDPRGELEGSDYIYDIGKLWHSVHGLYDFIHEDLFHVKTSVTGKKVTASLTFKHLQAIGTYQEIWNLLPNIVSKYVNLQEDPFWEMRALFAEAMHFCSVMPFHLKGDSIERSALALYFTAVKLINDFAERYRLVDYPIEIAYMNVNTLEDYIIMQETLIK